jgi:eukaryotic-like serine/threonine-protein kinase
MATVWVARERTGNPRNDRLVAVKVMLSELAEEREFVRMFLDEVTLVRAIRHPNVVDVYEVGEDGGLMWMAMQWVQGESLHAVIAEAGKRRAIPPELAVRIIADAAAGLHAAHELKDHEQVLRGVVHRDVSPHNILISTSGAVKLVDFGVAKAIGRISEATRAGQLKGKFGYMSPEQALGKTVDRRSDIFGLGIVLFELTTSRRLFRGEHDIDTLKLVTSGVIPSPTAIDAAYPPALERIVRKALERNVELRYQSALELERDLRAYLKDQHTVVPQSGIAGLLKRVLGERIEQRRKAVRASLKALSSAAGSGNDLLSSDSAFTPTDAPRGTPSDPSRGTGTGGSAAGTPRSAPSGVGVLPTAPLRSKPSMSEPEHGIGPAGWLGYAIGIAGLTIAVWVLLFMRR